VVRAFPAAVEEPLVTPPRAARGLLRIVLPDDHREPVIGDLDEEFLRRFPGRTSSKAGAWYWTQVVTSLPGAVRLRLRQWRFGIMSDWRFALRRLGRSPFFTIFAVLTLGVGIGMTTGIYSAVRAVLGPPRGVGNVDRVVNLYDGPRMGVSARLSWPDYQDLKARQSVFDLTAAWSWMGVAFSGTGRNGSAFGEIVDGGYFSVLGVAPARGRLLQPADDRPEAPPVVVISYGTWQRVFDAGEDVIGRIMKVNGHPFEIVGVASPEFRGLFNNGLVPSALWVPVSSAAKVYRRGPGLEFDPNDRDARFLLAKGVLKPGKTVEDARAQLQVIADQLDSTVPLVEGADRSTPQNRKRIWGARPMTEVSVSESTNTGPLFEGILALLALAVGAVLLVACTNLANLALARGAGRRQEIAVRLALGASRWRLVRESLVESLVVCVAGGLLGMGVARVITVVLSSELRVAGTAATLQLSPRLDIQALIVVAIATVLALVVAGLGPALQSTRADVRGVLVGDGSTGAAPRWRGRRYLITGQVTVSVVLLAVAALGITQLRSIQRQDYGFALGELAVAEVDFESQAYDSARIEQVVEGFKLQMSAHSEAVSTTVASGLPAGPTTFKRGRISGDAAAAPVFAEVLAGDVDLIPTVGLPLAHGRAWNKNESSTGNVAMLDQWTARKLFRATNVVGRDVYLREDEKTARRVSIVGIVSDTNRMTTAARRVALVYVPFHHDYGARVVFAVRTKGDPAVMAGALRQTLHNLDPELVLRTAGAGPDIVASTAQFFQVSSTIASLLGAFAWGLALAGLYGVLSHLVSRRTREIGIRVALGASRTDITRMIVREGLSPVILGIVVGLMLGALARLALQPRFLSLIPAMDVVVLVLVPVIFVGAAVLACYLPARRAADVDPNVALRQT
jgi:predicted permease